MKQRTAIYARRLGRCATIIVSTLVGSQLVGVRLVSAENYTISTTSYNSSGGHDINGGDRLKVAKWGQLITIDTNGVELKGVKNTLTNLGTISPSGGFAQGVQSVSRNKIINKGNIVTNGGFAQGINAIGNNRINNSGNISTSGGFAQGINAVNSNTIISSGTITTSGGFAQGINAETGNKITNRGNIITRGGFARGINLANGNTLKTNGSIQTNGGSAQGIYAQKSNKITNRGSIRTTGGFAQGIFAEKSNTIKNAGKIVTNGGFAQGIGVQTANHVFNSKTIYTTGGFAQGIYAQHKNFIQNTGIISTKGSFAHGVFAGTNNTIINNGRIVTSGDFAQGIFAQNGNRIINRKSISTSGDFAQGIHVGNNNTIHNYGTVKTIGKFGQGIFAGDNNRIINKGTIRTTGKFAQGIRAGDNNFISNSGRITSINAPAIQLGDSNTLQILPGSHITGDIDVGTNARVKISAGPAQSSLWDFSSNKNTQIVSDGLKKNTSFFNSNSKKLAVYDPSAIVAASNSLADFSGVLAGVTQQRLDQTFSNGAGNAVSINSYMPTSEKAYTSRIDKAFGKPKSAKTIPNPIVMPSRQAWVSLFGGKTIYERNADTNGHQLSNWGVAMGFDWAPSNTRKFGVLAGYNDGRLVAESLASNSYDNRTTGYFASLYGREKFSHANSSGEPIAAAIDYTITGGINRHSDRRLVNDNLVVNGETFASATYDSAWISPSVRYAVELGDQNSWVHMPSVGMRYTAQWLEGYTETGTSANATVSARYVASFEPSLEWAARKRTEFGWVKLSAGYIYRIAMGDETSRVSVIGQTNEISNLAKNRHIGYLGVNSNFKLLENLHLELNGKASLSNDLTGYEGKIRLISKF